MEHARPHEEHPGGVFAVSPPYMPALSAPPTSCWICRSPLKSTPSGPSLLTGRPIADLQASTQRFPTSMWPPHSSGRVSPRRPLGAVPTCWPAASPGNRPDLAADQRSLRSAHVPLRPTRCPRPWRAAACLWRSAGHQHLAARYESQQRSWRPLSPQPSLLSDRGEPWQAAKREELVRAPAALARTTKSSAVAYASNPARWRWPGSLPSVTPA